MYKCKIEHLLLGLRFGHRCRLDAASSKATARSRSGKGPTSKGKESKPRAKAKMAARDQLTNPVEESPSTQEEQAIAKEDEEEGRRIRNNEGST